MQHLVLASGSPRRRELLARIGIPFSICVSGIDESLGDHELAAPYAQAMSRGKARDIAERLLSGTVRPMMEDGKTTFSCGNLEDFIVLSADTVVARHNHILGKPADRADAERMLRLLSGGWHDVITAMTLLRPATGLEQTAVETTRVRFRPLDDDLIRRYLETGEPFDKAGAYGVQGYGSLLVERMDGDYYNVMGLPLLRLSQMLAEWGIEPLSWLTSEESSHGGTTG